MQPGGTAASAEGERTLPGSLDPSSVPLSEKVRFLRRPESYRPAPSSVTAIETHMAWVFLAGEFAYKLKKPVRYEFLDFRTLEARRRTCQEEVRLNRRLAPDVYLGVVPLTLEPGSRLALGGAGPVTDWLVHMRRLPSHRMLDRAMVRRPVSPDELRPAAELLAGFYRSLPSCPLEPTAYVDRLRRDAEDTGRGLLAPHFGLPGAEVREIVRVQTGFLDRHGRLLAERVEGGRIVEGHGDLRPDHVYLGPPPAIIDCLEFSRELRIVDPADELSFLALECARLGRPEVGAFFLRVYGERTGDDPPPAVLAFYRSSRAFLRAKLAIWHLRDDDVPDPEHWRDRARRYLALARVALAFPDCP